MEAKRLLGIMKDSSIQEGSERRERQHKTVCGKKVMFESRAFWVKELGLTEPHERKNLRKHNLSCLMGKTCLSSVPVLASLDCLVAEQGCVQEHSCLGLYRVLEYCTAEEAVAPLGSDARTECLEAQNALQHYRPLQVCKCQRGSRREEHCLRVYWTVRFAAYDEYEVSPYEELKLNLVRNIEMSRMASIMAGTDHEMFIYIKV
ncbi:unnamed protein product [Tetraodon nigroviridis]|uniref:(spotted green pufferfish) hypothetical protein n=1 Tax=Tetraodon nigroviridis TaxID=99883 RepID=Q4SFK6_TETNG|nr:unnamed protein product [Tetraodon nigroviridis]